MVGKTHLVEVVLVAPPPRTGGGGRPPLWVLSRASLSSGARGRACETAGAYRAAGSIALRPRSRLTTSSDPQRPLAFQNLVDV